VAASWVKRCSPRGYGAVAMLFSDVCLFWLSFRLFGFIV
jgi:hypothetical protein